MQEELGTYRFMLRDRQCLQLRFHIREKAVPGVPWLDQIPQQPPLLPQPVFKFHLKFCAVEAIYINGESGRDSAPSGD